jgi:5-formyltetrahydrofolate cyclo-ligase
LLIDPIIVQRSELRKSALNGRDEIPGNMRDAYSQLIRKKATDYLGSISAKKVHTYFGFNSEVGTRGIIEDLLEKGIKIVVPVAGKDRMIHSLLKDLHDLVPGNFQVPVPKKISEVSVDDLDAVLIPIVAFDGYGMRLGYGKGYYDRFLSTLSPKIKRIGLAFSIQEVEKIPKFSHDELINIAFTEQSDFFFNL